VGALPRRSFAVGGRGVPDSTCQDEKSLWCALASMAIFDGLFSPSIISSILRMAITNLALCGVMAASSFRSRSFSNLSLSACSLFIFFASADLNASLRANARLTTRPFSSLSSAESGAD
jgi:hypothetical protein